MKQIHKKLIGIGGIKCPCCRIGSLKHTRIRLNRCTRRATRMALHVALTTETYE